MKARERKNQKLLTIVCCILLFFTMSISGCRSSVITKNTAEDKTAQEVSSDAPYMAFDSDTYYARLQNSVETIQSITDFKPSIAIVLGSGLGHFAENEELDIKAEIPYSDIHEFPESTVKGHKGRLIFGTLAGKDLVIMQGRIHYYEGYDVHDVVFPLRVLHMLGAETIILTNAVGALNEDYRPGDFVAVKDHISDFVPSPLVGENLSQFGNRFVGMVDAYDPELRKLVLQIGAEEAITVHEGIFLQVTGPQYETPAEIRMFQKLGADTVGMSSVVEAIAARHMGMRVCDINSVTNMAAGLGESDFSHEEVLETADKQEDNFTLLLTRLIKEMD